MLRHVALLTLTILAGCAIKPPPEACAIGTRSLIADLFFGRSLRGGGTVSDADWQDFLAREVTPRFPDGLTVLNGRGQWRSPGTDRVTSEPSTVVIIIAQLDANTLQRLDAIRDAYRRRFQQDSVGLVTHPVCAAF